MGVGMNVAAQGLSVEQAPAQPGSPLAVTTVGTGHGAPPVYYLLLLLRLLLLLSELLLLLILLLLALILLLLSLFFLLEAPTGAGHGAQPVSGASPP